jgi:hypothetical protein
MRGKCSNKQYQIMAEIVKENNYQNIVNIGVYQGASIFPMAEICNGKIHCVDIWPIEEWKAAFVAGIKARKLTNCIVHHMSSDNFFESTTESIDFAFIDGNHDAEVVKRDILGSIRCGAKDILCHDYKDHLQRPGKRFGVETAVDDLIKEGVVAMIEEIEFMARLKPI